jgi:hypothetical protein
LVNELHRLSQEQRCAEFAGKSTGTVALESKSVVYRRPLKQEEVPIVPLVSSPPSPAATTSAFFTSTPTNSTTTTTTTATATATATATTPASPGVEKAVTIEEIVGEMTDVEIEIIDTPGIEAKSERQEQVQGEIFERLSEGFVEGGSPVHVILHCLNPSVPRLDDIEHEWIRAVSGYVSVILVYTHALTSPEEIKAWIGNTIILFPLPYDTYSSTDKLRPPLPIVTDVQVLARDEETGAKKKTLIKRFGMVELVEALADIYPQSLVKIDEHIKESKYVHSSLQLSTGQYHLKLPTTATILDNRYLNNNTNHKEERHGGIHGYPPRKRFRVFLAIAIAEHLSSTSSYDATKYQHK